MQDRRISWVKWGAGAAALAFSLAVASIALRPPVDAPEPVPAPEPAPAPEVTPAQPDPAEEAAVQAVPSGQPVTLQEAIFEAQGDGGEWLRLRFIAPRIGADAGDARVPFDAAADDLEYLCRAVALPVVERSGRPVTLIVLSLAESETRFGDAAPEITQYFEAFRPESGDCIWEEF
jgi:hypothetical protein